MRISDERKRDLLIRRGFTQEEIDNGFQDYLNGSDERWNINTITPEEVRDTDEQEDLFKLFRKDSVKNYFGIPFMDYGFEGYAAADKNSDVFRVKAAILEPYVARLVIAANQCCIFTSMSCDGWHEEQDDCQRKLIIWMRDRYSTVWFWIIAEVVFGEKWPRGKSKYSYRWEGLFEPDYEDWGDDSLISKVIYRIPKGKEKESYKKINEYARFLEEYCDELCGIRDKWVRELQKGMDPIEIDRMNFLRLRKTILNSAEDDLQRLSGKWKEMQGGR